MDLKKTRVINEQLKILVGSTLHLILNYWDELTTCMKIVITTEPDVTVSRSRDRESSMIHSEVVVNIIFVIGCTVSHFSPFEYDMVFS